MKLVSVLVFLFLSLPILAGDQVSAHILSGTTKTGERWEIYIDCIFHGDDKEIVKGSLKINGTTVSGIQEGYIVETSLENIKYFRNYVAVAQS